MRRLLALFLAAAIVAAACGDDSATVTTAPASGLGGPQEELDTLIRAAEDIRGLRFVEDPAIEIVTSEELAQRVRDQIVEDLEPDETLVQQRLYELLGLLDGSVDLGQAYLDLYAEAVGGFYDNDTHEMVIAGDQALSPLAKTLVVHELIHALTDQHFDFAARLDALVDEKRYHEASALQALAEGDALYYQLAYMQTLSTDEQVDAVQESLAADTQVADSLPDWFSTDLAWPYDAGFRFVERIVGDEDVPGLNQAYTLIPTTTEQIIHPGTYLTLQPGRPVQLPAATLDGYSIPLHGQWGEWNLQLYLLEGIDPGEAVVAATGWGGDDYRVYWNGTDIAFVYLYEGDTPRDAGEFADSLASAVAGRMAVGNPTTSADGTTFGAGDDFARIFSEGKQVLFIAAADPAVGQHLADQLGAGLQS